MRTYILTFSDGSQFRYHGAYATEAILFGMRVGDLVGWRLE